MTTITVRVAVVADSHFDESSRFEECVRLHDWMATDIAARGVDLVLHAGDVYERRSTPRERAAVADWLRRVADVAPVLLVRGNHDALGDLPLMSRLRARHPIVVEEACGVHLIGGVAVAAVAWPRKGELLARLGPVSPERTSAGALEALRDVLSGLGHELDQHALPRLLLAHAMVRGSVTSAGQPLVGCDMELGLEDLALVRADLVVLGHIHKGQEWTHDDVPIVYPGSPRRTAYGECEEKGYLLVTIEQDRGAARRVSWERITTPATPMLLVEATFRDGELVAIPLDRDSVTGAEIRLRYGTASDTRDAARRAALAQRTAWLDAGATCVKVEESVDAAVRSRAPEIAEARTLEEKLRVCWRMRGADLGQEREARLLDRLRELEQGEA